MGLLNNESTIDVFCNALLLVDTQAKKKAITIHTNGGEIIIKTAGYFPGYRWVWYNPERIANILALKNTTKRH